MLEASKTQVQGEGSPVDLPFEGSCRFLNVEHPKMMNVGLHVRICGRAGRTVAVDRFLKYVKAKPKVWIARRDDIAKWWLANYPP